VWEEEILGEITLLLQSINLQVDREDRWLWNLETSQIFSVRSAYHYMTAHSQDTSTMASPSIWHKNIPLKIVLFAWRLFRDRLPAKDSLFCRHVIATDSRTCVSRCGSLKNSSHLLLHCNTFGSVWHFIYRWLGISPATPYSVTDNFSQFIFAGGGAKARQSIMQVLWFATVWEIWQETIGFLMLRNAPF